MHFGLPYSSLSRGKFFFGDLSRETGRQMNTLAGGFESAAEYPVRIQLETATEDRNRLTTFFRILLAIPHLLLVGGPAAGALTWSWTSDNTSNTELGAGGGLLGAVAGIGAVMSWFAIVITGRHPEGLWKLGAFYLRWRFRAIAYTALLRDEYPPFGDGAYPADLLVEPPEGERDRLTVGFRFFLALPQLLVMCALGIAWCFTTIVAWFSVVFTGRYPVALYEFGVSVLRWHMRVEAYMLLLRDEYPPFSFD
jgi:hypothetical protein